MGTREASTQACADHGADGRMTCISVLIPALNEEDNVRTAYQRVMDVFDSLPDYEPEIIFTDNHSSDRTFEILAEIST